MPSGQFWVHRNTGGGLDFDSANYAYGAGGTSGAGFKVIAGDFTGDGLADFADLYTGHGGMWIHRNLGNGTFDRGNWSFVQTARPDSSWSLLGE
jgi:hypothetical protein